MDDTNPASPASSASSASDSEGFNTESARLYFGPLKTPERNFVASTRRLFPPVETPTLRRSPRLSSPRPQPLPSSSSDLEAAAEESEDIELVSQLVNEVEVDDEDELEVSETSNLQPGTPQRVELLLDEPSSVLADKILHAADNPSPPPSPPAPLTFFDLYQTITPETSADYQTDLKSLSISGGAECEDINPLMAASTSTALDTLLLSQNTNPPMGDLPSQDLISFDSFPPSQEPRGSLNGDSPKNLRQILTMDDMLSRSPFIMGSPQTVDSKFPIPPLVIETIQEALPNEGPMSVDSPKDESQLLPDSVVPKIQEERDAHEPNTQTSPTTVDPAATPVRRSTRPRKSVAPNPPPVAVLPPVFFTHPTPVARTSVRKKKSANINLDEEVVSDSEGEDDDPRGSPSRAMLSQARHRSPGKEPISFHRELGSLSPTSANVLSSLGFTSTEDQIDVGGLSTNQPQSSSEPSAMFSFSVFAPPSPAPAAPSTPIRPSGPIRISSPTKAQTSPNKFRIQTQAPNNPNHTPARRIPIEQAIAQGHVSPEKAVKMGFKANGTPLPTVSTPARRILISEKQPTLAANSGGLRFGSPIKQLPGQRGRSAEPQYRVLSSTKGKEKAITTSLALPSSSMIKPLPFPIVAAASIDAPSYAVQTTTQGGLSKSTSSPTKSSLKQPTSKIPRIGAKPYTRTNINGRASEKAKAPSTIRAVDLEKPLSKPMTAESTITYKRPVRITESSKPSANSMPRVKPTISTSTTLLKRKREAEKLSPVKPRVIMLRQVPAITPPAPSESSTSLQPAAAAASVSAKGKRQPQGTVRFRRVVSPESQIVKQPSLPLGNLSAVPSKSGSEEATITYKPQDPKPSTPPPPSEPKSQHTEPNNIPPGSPIKQDVTNVPPAENVECSAPLPTPTILITEPPSTTADDASVSAFSLRRTTRSRRGVLTQDVASEGTSRTTISRRKAASYQSDDVFSGMSITALKDLTTSNTLRNQRYLAAKLELEVVRKDGLRPESPAVKIKTVAQRQQEQDKMREERAKRRARRSGDEMAMSDMEASSDVGYSSPAEDTEDVEMLPKHQRGAGDEDDYETPDRPMRTIRTRLFDDGSGEAQQNRRVKWDRGLFTFVYLDEVKLGNRQTLKENRTLKGCLAPTAKAFHLDTLGNLPQADSLLADLIPENVTVKKFVYDNDIPPAPEIAVVKNTKSKRRK